MSIPRLTSLRDGVTGELHAGVADVLLALAVAVVSLASMIPHVEGSLVTLGLSASLAIRRTHPEAAAEERNEIAREVHDIVAHSLSMIAVQAEGGRALAARSPDGAAAVLSEIADEARNALNEIRDMVGFLRQGRLPGVSSHEGHRPAPDLGDVRELVGRLGDRAGLRIAGRVRPIGPLVAFTVHRVVQEALTNFVRHAGPSATVQVTVAFGDDVVDVTVRDDGLGAAAAASDGKGNGLHTMKERVLAHAGR
jgi:signal transduction histidine kinase